VNEGISVIFRSYIDESFDKHQKIFAFSCLTLMGKDWREMERIWNLRLSSVNKKLKKQRRPKISRYHASDCSGRRKEFQGWSHDERDDFVKDLFGVFKRIPTQNVCVDMKLDDLCEVFPEFSGDRLRGAYAVSTQAIIELLAKDYSRLSKILGDDSVRFTLFHDRTANGKYDPVILETFNRTILGPCAEFKDYFTTIAPMSWEHCIALQPADLVAFEVFKQAEGREEARKMRKSFQALIDLDEFGIHSTTLHKAGMIDIRRDREAHGLLAPFSNLS
jgi:hypothetical protein